MTATTANLDVALSLARKGMHVFPCHSGGDKVKQPLVQWRLMSTTDPAKIARWWQRWPDAAPAIDLAKSSLIVIDADRHDEHDGVHEFGLVMADHGFHPDTAPLVATPNEGNHHFFRQPPGKQMGNGRGSLPSGVDVRGSGGYVIAPGAVMADGRFYELHGDLGEAPVIPDWLVAIIEARKSPPEARNSADCEAKLPENPAIGNQPANADEIAELLSYIPADCSYHDWVAVLMAVHAATDGGGLALADQWSATGSKYPGSKDLAKKWQSFKRQGITISTLAELARQHGADLAAIAMKHRGVPHYDPIEAAHAARVLIESHDGKLADAETGEIMTLGQTDSHCPSLPYPPGLVGQIAKWIVATARRPQPELAIGAALAIVGTVAGRQFAGPTMSGTHLYVLGLAPTGKGKDHPLQQIGRVMAAANLARHLGPSEFISMPAVVNFLMRKPLSVCAMDEFGSFMKRINSRRASGFETAISKIIRTMWSSSFAPYHTPEWAQKASETIFAPALTLYGASTPEQFYSAMEGASLEDGTLNRFLLLPGRDRAKEVEPGQDATKVPEWLSQSLKRIYGASGEMATTWRNDPAVDPGAHDAIRAMAWSPDGAKARYDEFSKEVEALIEAEPERGAFHARTVEMALRVATIVAIGRLDEDAVRKSDLEYGIEVARASATFMAEGAADYMADNENQANAQKVIRCIRARGGRVTYRALLQSLKNSIKARDLRELLQSMHDAGQIERQEVKAATGPPSYWYQVL